MPFRLVIVEDIPLFREYLCRFCEQDLGYEVAGSCGDANEACELIRRSWPDLVLVDLGLIGGNGFAVAEMVARECSGVRCALMSAHCTDVVAKRVQMASVCGFIDKNTSDMDEIRHALRELEQGHTYYSSSFLELARKLRLNKSSFDKILSNREQQVLALIGLAKTDNEIGEQLAISGKTVITHRRNILHKLQVGSTPKLIRYAIDHGMTQFMAKPVEPASIIV